VPIARPRSIETIDELAVGRLSRQIRAHLAPALGASARATPTERVAG
jgi:hypothetical protein